MVAAPSRKTEWGSFSQNTMTNDVTRGRESVSGAGQFILLLQNKRKEKRMYNSKL